MYRDFVPREGAQTQRSQIRALLGPFSIEAPEFRELRLALHVESRAGCGNAESCRPAEIAAFRTRSVVDELTGLFPNPLPIERTWHGRNRRGMRHVCDTGHEGVLPEEIGHDHDPKMRSPVSDPC